MLDIFVLLRTRDTEYPNYTRSPLCHPCFIVTVDEERSVNRPVQTLRGVLTLVSYTKKISMSYLLTYLLTHLLTYYRFPEVDLLLVEGLA